MGDFQVGRTDIVIDVWTPGRFRQSFFATAGQGGMFSDEIFSCQRVNGAGDLCFDTGVSERRPHREDAPVDPCPGTGGPRRCHREPLVAVGRSRPGAQETPRRGTLDDE